MPRMTETEYLAFLARNEYHEPGQHRITGSQQSEDEAILHDEIMAECRRRGWICFHGSMTHRTHRTAGEPDFVILAHLGRALMVEAKTRTGKLTTDQRAISAWARKLGHRVHVVRSLEEFNHVADHDE